MFETFLKLIQINLDFISSFQNQKHSKLIKIALLKSNNIRKDEKSDCIEVPNWKKISSLTIFFSITNSYEKIFSSVEIKIKS